MVMKSFDVDERGNIEGYVRCEVHQKTQRRLMEKIQEMEGKISHWKDKYLDMEENKYFFKKAYDDEKKAHDKFRYTIEKYGKATAIVNMKEEIETLRESSRNSSNETSRLFEENCKLKEQLSIGNIGENDDRDNTIQALKSEIGELKAELKYRPKEVSNTKPKVCSIQTQTDIEPTKPIGNSVETQTAIEPTNPIGSRKKLQILLKERNAEIKELNAQISQLTTDLQLNKELVELLRNGEGNSDTNPSPKKEPRKATMKDIIYWIFEDIYGEKMKKVGENKKVAGRLMVQRKAMVDAITNPQIKKDDKMDYSADLLTYIIQLLVDELEMFEII